MAPVHKFDRQFRKIIQTREECVQQQFTPSSNSHVLSTDVSLINEKR